MLCDEPSDDCGAFLIWGWDAEVQTFFRLRRGDQLERGKGYWFHMSIVQGLGRALPR